MSELIFRVHALQRMFEREIRDSDVRHVLSSGEVIRSYPDDTPYPSRLILGWVGPRPIHVVAADADDGATIIITVYEPSPDLWTADFKERKQR